MVTCHPGANMKLKSMQRDAVQSAESTPIMLTLLQAHKFNSLSIVSRRMGEMIVLEDALKY